MSPSGMRQPGELLMGCVAHGVTHSTASVPDLATRFEMVRDVGVFDFVDRIRGRGAGAGRPFIVMQASIDAGWVLHAHARAAVPANPVNQWARHPDGSVGRGI